MLWIREKVRHRRETLDCVPYPLEQHRSVFGCGLSFSRALILAELLFESAEVRRQPVDISSHRINMFCEFSANRIGKGRIRRPGALQDLMSEHAEFQAGINNGDHLSIPRRY